MRLEFDENASILIVADERAEGSSRTASAGEVFRQLRLRRPKALMIWIDRSDLEKRTALMAEAHRRCPQVPLIALSPEHDEQLERAVRIAGAAYYFSLINENDHRLLNQALITLGIDPTAIPAYTGLSPPVKKPRTRASPPQAARARGRPSRMFEM